MLGSTLNRRFRLEQRLDAAPNSQQYLATDASNGEMLTVRFLPRHVSLRGEAGLRYRRALARLKGLHHPNLLVPVEAATANGVAFLASPYYPSVTLTEALAGPSLTVAEVALVMRQCAAALEVLHRAGVIHGGVNLDNILISREDTLQAVLAHPALAILVPPEEASAHAAQFKAPEEHPAVESAPDGRADLFALGMVAWRLLTGEMPFTSATPSEAYRQQLSVVPPNPRTRNPEIPARLAAIVMRLLSKAPDQRYQSAAGLAADLESWDQSTDRMLGEQDILRPFTQIQPILGRETARAALLASLGRAGSGQGSIVVLAGASGMGIGRLFRALQPQLLSTGTLVLRARPPVQDACPPFFLLSAWSEDLLSQWDLLPDLRRRDILYRLHQAVGGNGALLTALVPGLGPLLPEAGQPPVLDTAREHLRVLHTVAEAITALADPRHPLLLWIEDLTRIDGDSLALLRFLNDRLVQSALVIAGAYPLEGAATGAMAEWLQSPLTRRHTAWVEVPPLGSDAIRASVASLLGIPFQAPPPRAVDQVRTLAAWLERHWDGLPLAHETALRLLVARDVLAPDVAHRAHGLPWRLDVEALENLRVPETVAGLLREWLATLPEGLILMLEAAAALPGAITLDALSVVMDGFPLEALEERMEAAVHHGVFYRTRDGMCFAEPRLRQAIEDDTSPVRREMYHQALGAGIEARTDRLPLHRHHAAAWHFGQGGDRERADQHQLSLVPAALGVGAFHGAIAAFRAISEGARARLSHADGLVLIAAAAAAGHCPFAADLAGQRLAAAGAATEQADLLLAQAHHAAEQGELTLAFSSAEHALAAIGEPLPAHAMGAALARLADGAARRYVELMATAAGGALSRLTPDEERHCRALEVYSRIAARRDLGRAATADERILRIAAPRMVSGYLLRALIRLGRAEAHQEAPPLQEAAELLNTSDLPAEAVALGIAQSDGAHAQFQLLRARDGFDRARESARTLGHLLSEAEAELGLFDLARLQGPVEALTRAAERLQRLAALTHVPDLEAIAKAANAIARATAEAASPGPAVSAVVAAAEYFAAKAQPDAARHWIAAALELMLTLGHSDEARRCFALADRLGEPLRPLDHGRLTAALAEWHLVLALALPDQPHPMQQARAELKALRALGRDHALLGNLWEGLAAIERVAQGRIDEGLSRMSTLEAAMESQGARLLWGRLCLRTAEALKPVGDNAWLAWGGKALMAFDGVGAAGFADAARRLMDLVPQDPVPRAGEPSTAANGPIAAGLVSWFERLAEDGVPSLDTLHEAVLRLFLDQSDGERAALYRPNADGQLALIHQLPPDPLVSEPFNRWMVETVRREGQGHAAGHYLPPNADPALAAVQEAQSVLCIPLAAAGGVQGVVALSSSRSRRVYDSGDVARLAPLARQAGILLALNNGFGELTGQRNADSARDKRARELLDWSLRAVSGTSADDILGDYLGAIAQPLGFEAALLFRIDSGTPPALRPELIRVTPPMTLQDTLESFPLREVESQAAAAWRTLSPVAMSGGGGPPPSAAEQTLFNHWRARDAQWLPLSVRGDAIGMLLLLSRERRALAARQVETDLLAPLLAVAPALARFWDAGDQRQEQQALLRRQAELQETAGRLRRYLPAALDSTRRFPDRPGAAVEVSLPVVAGLVQGMNRLSSLGALEWSRALDAYFERVGQGLELHQGVLDRIAGAAWLAHFPGGAHNAIWGAHTLHGLLSTLADDRAARGGIPLRTGIGVHLGPALAATLGVGERLEAMLEGEAVRGAQALAEMAEQLRCGVLISGDLAQEAGSLPDIALRPFGAMRLGAGERRLEVFDLYSASPRPVAAAMAELHGMWDTAMRHFRLAEWDRAWPLFHRYAARLPEDRAARYFLRRCKLRQREASEASRSAD